MRMARSWEAAFVEDLAQQTALAPLHDHVDPGTLLAAKDLHDVGMVEPFTDGPLALEAVKENGIGFHVGMGNFQGDGAVVALVRGP